MPKTRQILDSSPAQIPAARPLKRSASVASVASLPTPPRTTHKVRRGSAASRAKAAKERARSQSRAPSHHSSFEDSTDGEGDDERKPNVHKRQKTLKSVAEQPEDEEAFWLGGGSSQQTIENTSPPPALTQYCARVDKSTQSLASPPPSKRQGLVPATPKHTTNKSLVTPRRSGRLNRRRELTDSDEHAEGPLRDSPENPFLATDDLLPKSPESPTPAPQGEKPTVIYVFRGVRREFANPHYDPSNPTSSRVKPQSLLPISHPDYSPDEICKPQVLFKTERRKRIAAKLAKPVTPTKGAKTALMERASSPFSDGENEESDGPIPLKLDFTKATMGETKQAERKAAAAKEVEGRVENNAKNSAGSSKAQTSKAERKPSASTAGSRKSPRSKR